ncbi:hypothetical protein ABIB06_001993 [Bradyrhizobium sp. LB8.2]|uniref:adenylate/guanylate cyclase domain-containing protein n=1 Tax=unclassified Bradyrhizobium TaxID=2631580 RepID=UPI003397E985
MDSTWASGWGTWVTMRHFLPSHADEPDVARQYAKLERLAFSPGALKMAARYNIVVEVRAILSFHSSADPGDTPSKRRHVHREGKFLASQISGAQFLAYADCRDHLIFPGDRPRLCGDIEEFVTGHRETTASDVNRVLATVLFADIVDSTRRAAEMGDQAWRRVLDEHDRAAQRIVVQHRGNLIKTTGDGILATFDGPGGQSVAQWRLKPQLGAFVCRAGRASYWRNRAPNRRHRRSRRRACNGTSRTR